MAPEGFGWVGESFKKSQFFYIIAEKVPDLIWWDFWPSIYVETFMMKHEKSLSIIAVNVFCLRFLIRATQWMVERC